jgi:hypothetical protein
MGLKSCAVRPSARWVLLSASDALSSRVRGRESGPAKRRRSGADVMACAARKPERLISECHLRVAAMSRHRLVKNLNLAGQYPSEYRTLPSEATSDEMDDDALSEDDEPRTPSLVLEARSKT